MTSTDRPRHGRHSSRHVLISAALLAMSLAGAHRVAAQTVDPISTYIPTRDGTRLAVDVYLPPDRERGARVPALLELTRYWRAGVHPETGIPRPSLSPLDRHFLNHGYAVLTVDVRGSGASFGTRPVEYGPQEVKDGYDVVDWVIAQDWSSGSVGAYGTSYTGTTAELLAAVEHPAVKAVIPGWSDFEPYGSPIRPYGLVPTFIEDWGFRVGAMDRNDPEVMKALVRPVDEDIELVLRADAVAEHRSNPDVYQTVMNAEHRDDVLAGGITYAETGPFHWRREISRSGVPMLVLVSWLDAGTIEGTFQRFNYFDNPQKVLILASNHGGRMHASPYKVSGEPVDPEPSEQEQFEMRRKFLDRYLKGVENDVDDWPPIRYYNMGEEAYRETDVWPPSGLGEVSFYLASGNRLVEMPPASAGSDAYKVDFGVSTGRDNRWRTQLGGPVLNLDDRGPMDARMLTYTTAPLDRDLQITGTPVVTIELSSTHTDGAVLAYIEDVDPSGRSRYLTEGGLRLIHRKAATDTVFEEPAFHTYSRGDAGPMVPGRVETISVRLWPTSALIRRGHRLRLAIAGADDGTFVRVPASGEPTLRVHWDGDGTSMLRLQGNMN